MSTPVSSLGCIGIIGTGMMATGIATAYSQSGIDVMLGSRDEARGRRKASEISSSLNGHACGSCRGGSIPAVLEQCSIIFLPVPTRVQYSNGSVQDGVIDFLQQYGDNYIRGRGKILIDTTYYGRGNFGRPTPPSPFLSALHYHSSSFGDESTSWATSYKSVSWISVRDFKRQGLEIAGDPLAKQALAALIAKTGFMPLDCGDIINGGAVVEPGGPNRRPHPQADV